jgi:hypothetical protein
MSVTLNGTSGLVFSDGTIQGTAAGMAFRNRIINGDMRINQRGLTLTNRSSGGGADGYAVDRFRDAGSPFSTGRWSLQQLTDAPVGFTNSIGLTVTTAQPSISGGDLLALTHIIEGFNTADLSWGTSNASTATLSFWVKTSTVGQYSVTLHNGASTGVAYNATYTVSAANTWEYKTIVIPGPTAGTWGTTNGSGVRFDFILASATYQTANSWVTPVGNGTASNVNILATNGNTFRMTGVQLEKAGVATSFEHRSFGVELALCQRYYQIHHTPNHRYISSTTATAGVSVSNEKLHVPMRTAPSCSQVNGSSTCTLVNINSNSSSTQTIFLEGTSITTYRFYPGGTSAGISYLVEFANNIQCSAEL